MHRALSFALFFTLTLAFYALMHVSVGAYLAAAFPGAAFTLSMVLAAGYLLSIVGLLLQHWSHAAPVVWLYRGSTVWMGAVFVAFLVLFPLDLLARFFGVPRFALIVLPLLGLLVIYGVYNALMPKIKRVTVILHKKLAKPVRVVQLTDLHIGAIYTPEFLAHVVDETNKQHPDFVVITGDLFDGGKFYDHMVTPLKKLEAPAYFVSGNHEVYAGLGEALHRTQAAGVKILDGRVAKTHGVQLVGVPYTDTQTTARLIRELTKPLDHTKPIILLRHEPADALTSEQAKVDLKLSGHTHHGQIWPLSHIPPLIYKYSAGLHRVGHMQLYISHGTGSWGPPLRLGSRSEITILTITGSL